MDISKNSRGDASKSRIDLTRGDQSRDNSLVTDNNKGVQIFNLRNLRKFDQQSGGFKDKDFY